ncbi:hypothetical protein GCM10012275_02520 [Longimycelium tulufanense]|uniref:Uncharacterized protein n=1 Tax=Longimycelium tulufanense TaxID=907463 RepID=A0A8J3FSF0_9PSEU|nr:hypothetical protein [Longimycelium tulufanense]GGM34726.1 hypothetical protein GCM10012275_02520 [Longimycelium tulufanense]
MDTLTTMPVGLVEVMVRRGDRMGAMLGEPTSSPGLFIVPDPGSDGVTWTGNFCVVHSASGHTAVRPTALAYAREVAEQLAESGVDWTRPLKELHTRDEAKDAYLRVMLALDAAEDTGTPLRWARLSWRQHPPLYRILGDRYYDDVVFRGWPELVDWLDQLVEDYWSPSPTPTARVVRDTNPAWQLVCAAPLCGHRRREPAAVHFTTEDGDEFEGITSERHELVEAAAYEGWRDVDGEHWMCPHCSAAHPKRTEWERC